MKHIEKHIAEYIDTVQQILSLTEEEEAAVLGKAIEGDKAAKKRLTETHLKTVVEIARQYEGQGLDLIDLIQEGNCGLIRAIDHLELLKDCAFSEFAQKYIKNEIVRLLSDKRNWILRSPVRQGADATTEKKGKE